MPSPCEKTAQQKIRDLEELLEIAKALTVHHDLDTLLQMIMQEVTKLLEADRSTLFLVDQEKQELWSKIIQDASLKEIRLAIGQGLAGHVAQTGEVINIQDAYTDPRFFREVDQRTGYRTRSLLCAPLINYDDTIIGVIQVLNKKKGTFTAYDESLLLALGSHAAIAISNAQLFAHYLEKQQMQQALDIARRIQQKFLPQTPPLLEGFDIAGTNISCDETGGDYYDYIQTGPEEVAIVLGDVSGHGIGSALLMATARASLRSLVTHISRPADMLFHLNNRLAEDMEEGRFMTFFYGILNAKQKTLRYANAGHPYPICYRPSKEEWYTLESTGIPLGIFSQWHFEEGTPFSLQAEDVLLFLTDGVTEAQDAAGEMLGEQWLRDTLRQCYQQSASDILAHILSSLKQRIVHQKDDITLVVIKVH